MQCNELEQILEQQADGPFPELATAHINGCNACRALTADIEAIHTLAIELGAEETAPPERLWITLRNQLEAEGIIHDPSPAPQSVKHGWWFAFQRPELAGAFLFLVLIAAGLIGYMGNSTQMAGHPTVPRQIEFKQEASAVPLAENIFKEELLTVGNQNIPGFRARDAAVMDSIRRNLNIVDNFIAMCEKSVREQPENEMAREYLYGAYEQKAELVGHGHGPKHDGRVAVNSTCNAVRVGTIGAVMTGFALIAAPARADRVEKHFPVQSKPMVTVRNASGRIQVKAWSKNEVQVAWTNAGGKAVVETEQAGNRIEVATHMANEKASPEEVKTDFEITVPVESELSVRTDSGNVTVDSVHGDMTFDTVGANLQLSDVDGYMVIKTIDGSLVCTRCAGKLEANSISGNMQMIQPTLDSVRVQTSSGNILFDGSFLNRGVYIMKNFSGTIEVHFSSSDSFDVNATSLKGNVINQASFKPDTHGSHHTAPKIGQSLFGTMNDGHAKVELSSFSGTIKILKRD